MKDTLYSQLLMLLPLDDINLTPVAPPGVGDKIQTVLNWVFWFAMVAGIVGVIGAGVGLAWMNRTGNSNESVERVIKVLVGLAIIGGATSIVSIFF